MKLFSHFIGILFPYIVKQTNQANICIKSNWIRYFSLFWYRFHKIFKSYFKVYKYRQLSEQKLIIFHACTSHTNRVQRIQKDWFIAIVTGLKFYQIKTEIDKVTWYTGPIIKAARNRHTELLCKEAKLQTVQNTNLPNQLGFKPLSN